MERKTGERDGDAGYGCDSNGRRSRRMPYISYKGEQAYQPINTYWYERGVMLHTEFRDGNVPAGYEQLRVLKEAALGYLPAGSKKGAVAFGHGRISA